jgi:serine protease AprX
MKHSSPTIWHALLLGILLGIAGPAVAVSGSNHHRPGKLSDEARQRGRARGAGSVDVIVRFHSQPGAREDSVVSKFGGQVRRRHRSRWMTVRVPGNRVEKLADDPTVEFVAVDAPIAMASLDASRETAGLPDSYQPDSGLKGAGVTIAQVDSGVALRPELGALVASVDFIGTYDPSFAASSSVDPHGHGTHVAGIMVGDGTHSANGSLVGIAPQASLVSVRVLNEAGQGTSSSLLAGLQWVLDHKDQYGIRVLNLSLGHPIYEPPDVDPLVQAVEELWDAGIVVVCSAGNDGRLGHGTISSPCNSRKVITVGALNDRKTDDRSDDTVATYSSRGPTRFDLVSKPDLLAPGNKIWSTRSPGSTLDVPLPGSRIAADPNQPWRLDYFELSGTSMAAPMVSGAAALLLEQDPTLNPATVKARLMLSARKAAVGDPFATGAGALDIEGALHTPGVVQQALSPLVIVDSSDPSDPTPATSNGLRFENTAVLWGDPTFALATLWGEAVLWAESTGDYLTSDGVLLPELDANATLWPDSTSSAEGTLWPESTLWAEAVLWPDSADDVAVGALGLLVGDP